MGERKKRHGIIMFRERELFWAGWKSFKLGSYMIGTTKVVRLGPFRVFLHG